MGTRLFFSTALAPKTPPKIAPITRALATSAKKTDFFGSREDGSDCFSTAATGRPVIAASAGPSTEEEEEAITETVVEPIPRMLAF